MIIELATVAWFCVAPIGVCYDTANVHVRAPEVTTTITDGEAIAGLIVNCAARTHTVVGPDGDSLNGEFEEGSLAALLCDKYLPTS